MNPQQAITEIVTILHRYSHPAYDKVTYCTFCYARAAQIVEQLPDDD